MNAPPLQRHADRFEERNSFIFALLGVVSWANASSALMQATLGTATAAGAVSDAGAAPDAASQGGDPTLVEGLLGLVKLERTAAAIILSWAEQAIVPKDNPDVTHAEGLLR
ncbi:MAG TPA: hypothetical protein VN764_19160 [Polyangiaceae bacterium]|nr:hypothetical protein [Polyangiaceae bacterium]